MYLPPSERMQPFNFLAPAIDPEAWLSALLLFAVWLVAPLLLSAPLLSLECEGKPGDAGMGLVFEGCVDPGVVWPNAATPKAIANAVAITRFFILYSPNFDSNACG